MISPFKNGFGFLSDPLRHIVSMISCGVFLNPSSQALWRALRMCSGDNGIFCDVLMGYFIGQDGLEVNSGDGVGAVWGGVFVEC